MHNYCGYCTHRLHFHLPLLMKILHPLVQLLVMLHTNRTWELSPKNKPTPLFLMKLSQRVFLSKYAHLFMLQYMLLYVNLASFPGAEKGEGKKERLVTTVRTCALISKNSWKIVSLVGISVTLTSVRLLNAACER